MNYQNWTESTNRGITHPRSKQLQAVDVALDRFCQCSWYQKETKKLLLRELDLALRNWKESKPNWQNSIRNSTGTVEVLSTYVAKHMSGIERLERSPSYKVTATDYSTSRRVPYHAQGKTMNCWWASASMVLDYHFGQQLRCQIMQDSEAARTVLRANQGITWDNEMGRQIQQDFGLRELELDNQGSDRFRPADIRKALIENGGPLLFSGAFVRMFRQRFYHYGHVIVVYGVTHDSVWYHDPGLGLELFTASQELNWNDFKNAWHPERTEQTLRVHGVSLVPGTEVPLA